VLVDVLPSGELYVSGLITGLNASVAGGWHVHSGFSCDDPSLVGGHYFAAGEVDPWISTRYTSNSRGVATLDHAVDGFSLTGVLPVLGRALVVHNSFGARVACGVIEPVNGRAVVLGRYPGTSGQGYEGVVIASASSGSVPTLSFRGSLSGLPAESSGGWHIHSGYTCEEAAGVGGHYLVNGLDPWLSVRYTTDARGVATLTPINTPPVVGCSIERSFPVDLRAMVVHSPSSARVMCGLLGLSPTGPTPSILPPGTFNPIDVLSAYTAELAADWIDTLIVAMRAAGMGVCAVFFIGSVAFATIILIPPFLLALGLGYTWTYAFGGTNGGRHRCARLPVRLLDRRPPHVRPR